MKTLAICFTQDSAVEIKFDDTIVKMYQAQKAIEDRILNAEDPAEEEAKIEAEAEAALAKLEMLHESLEKLNQCSVAANIALILRDNCKNRITLADLDKIANTTFTDEIVDADKVPDDIRALADADEEKNSH